MGFIKINNKNYTVPEFGFRHSRLLEQYGVSLQNLVSIDHILTIAGAFVAIVANCDLSQADYLIDQHILSGGTLQEIYDAYVKAISESHFFKKLLENREKNQEEKQTEETKSE